MHEDSSEAVARAGVPLPRAAAEGATRSVRLTQLVLGLPPRYVAEGRRVLKSTRTVTTAKQLGAYYTDKRVAALLVRWATRAGSGVRTVLDPACGDGVFLGAACQALADGGGLQPGCVLGVDVDPAASAAARARVWPEFGAACCQLVVRDFFEFPGGAYRVDAVVGNPPFVRFHRFAGEQRGRALGRAADQGVRLSGLSSSWAPFVVHAMSMLRDGGQLAMVLPVELTYAVYARPVLAHLLSEFAEVSVITFRLPLFPELNEGTLLLLARGKGRGPGILTGLDLADADSLDTLTWDACGSPCGARALAVSDRGTDGQRRLSTHLLPAEAADLWLRVSGDVRLCRLGDVADLGIGYVTGANDFFHLSSEAVNRWAIPSQFLADAVVRSRALTGLSFSALDWRAGLGRGYTSRLLHANGAKELPPEVLAYLRYGEEIGIPGGYKCRNRQPWYSVPQVAPPDAFLTYMSHDVPRVVANVCGAVAPNTLHCVRLRCGSSLDGPRLALLWCNSLSRLSAEIEGHALGGGMLKLEPAEARRALLPPIPDAWFRDSFADLFRELDGVAREGRQDEVLDRVDRMVLSESMGLDDAECRALRDAARLLRNRRLRRAA